MPLIVLLISTAGMKIIIAPDKFKGSLTSFNVCKSIEAGIKQANATARVHCFPMADGGDGFAEVLKHYLNTQTTECDTVDPLQRNITASYQWDEVTKTAIIELAVASGLILLKDEERNPMETSTYGTGLLIKEAITKGAKKIILGLGGSATNDAGTGILAALGFIFLDKNKKVLQPKGGNLLEIQEILPPANKDEIELEVACDVINPLFGRNGAAYIYAPQKGANTDEVQLLDDGLRHINNILVEDTGKNYAEMPGAGAAGGIAVGLMNYYQVKLKQGIEMVIAASGIKDTIHDADIIITGEGKIDSQSMEGKVVSSIADIAKKYSIPVIGLCGVLQLDYESVKQLGLTYASAICKGPLSPVESMKNASKLLEEKSALCCAFYSNFFK